jgi:hypothetical protein
MRRRSALQNLKPVTGSISAISSSVTPCAAGAAVGFWQVTSIGKVNADETKMHNAIGRALLGLLKVMDSIL